MKYIISIAVLVMSWEAVLPTPIDLPRPPTFEVPKGFTITLPVVPVPGGAAAVPATGSSSSTESTDSSDSTPLPDSTDSTSSTGSPDSTASTNSSTSTTTTTTTNFFIYEIAPGFVLKLPILKGVKYEIAPKPKAGSGKDKSGSGEDNSGGDDDDADDDSD